MKKNPIGELVGGYGRSDDGDGFMVGIVTEVDGRGLYPRYLVSWTDGTTNRFTDLGCYRRYLKNKLKQWERKKK